MKIITLLALLVPHVMVYVLLQATRMKATRTTMTTLTATATIMTTAMTTSTGPTARQTARTKATRMREL